MIDKKIIEELKDFFKRLSTSRIEREVDLHLWIDEFLKILGYNSSNLFLEPLVQNLRPDIIVGNQIGSLPHLVIELKIGNIERACIQLKEYITQLRARIGILFSNKCIVIMKPNKIGLNKRVYELEKITKEKIKEIITILKFSGRLPTKKYHEIIKIKDSFDAVLKFSNFEISINILENKMKQVELASSNDEKKKSLESLAEYLFECIPFFKVKARNLRTKSSEIDFVIEIHHSIDLPNFIEFGNYILIECKNWTDPVSSNQIRNFIGNLRKTKVNIGILFAKNGITGEQDGANALREIHSAFDRDSIFVIVFTFEDIREIRRGANFFEMLEDKIFTRRFDVS